MIRAAGEETDCEESQKFRHDFGIEHRVRAVVNWFVSQVLPDREWSLELVVMGCGGCWRVARGNLVMHFCNAEAVRVDEAQALAAALGRNRS